MGTEIERRFLLKNPRWRPAGVQPVQLDQGRYFFGEDAEGVVAYCFGLPLFSLTPHGQGAPLLILPLPLADAWGLTLQAGSFAPGLGGVTARMPKGWMARIRAYNHERFVLDIKGPRTGTTRAEFGEFALNRQHGETLLTNAPPASKLSKQRYTLQHEGHTWVIDVYNGGKGHFQPTCEIELPSPQTPFVRPDWVGDEITHRKTFLRPALQPDS